MSIPITKIEATAVARFLSASHFHLDGTRMPHSSWLHRLAHAFGFRNWNGMTPAIAQVPDIARFGQGFGSTKIGFRRFAIACVSLPGRKAFYRAVGSESKEQNIQALARELAASVARTGRFQGTRFRYTRPDPQMPAPPGDERSAAAAPAVATSADGGTRIVLWWLRVLLSTSYERPDEVTIRQPVFEHWPNYYERNPTECFLEALTGIPGTPRQCLYVPIQASPAWLRHEEAYHPLILTEGRAEGEDADWHCGVDRMLAVRRAYLENRRAGLSNLDIADIADAHRRNELDPNEEPEADVYWMSED